MRVMSRKTALAASLVTAVAATPAMADGWGDWSGWWDWSAPVAPVYHTLVESVPYTGQTHLVILTGDGLFPENIYADDGDRILFVNMTTTTYRVEAWDKSWATGDLSKHDGYMLFVQPGLQNAYRDAGGPSGTGWDDSSAIIGEVMVNQMPNEVNFPQTSVPLNTLFGLMNIPLSTLDDALADVVNLGF